MRRICIVGGGARELAVARSVKSSPLCGALVCIAPAKNPAIAEICDEYKIGKADSPDDVAAFCKETKVDIAFIGPEAPLAAGVVDALEAAGIGAVGPTKALSKVESSKEYCRQVCGLVASLEPLRAARPSPAQRESKRMRRRRRRRI